MESSRYEGSAHLIRDRKGRTKSGEWMRAVRAIYRNTHKGKRGKER